MTARDLFTEEPKQVLEKIEQLPAADPDASRARVCGGCTKALRGEVAGFLNCVDRPKWEYRSPSAPCFFEPVRWVESPRAKAQAGIDQAVAHADRVRPGWSTDALAFIRSFAATHKGTRLTGYELVQHSVRAGFEQPATPQGWGGPLQRASRTGLLVKVGSVPDPNPARHGSDVPLWEVA